MLTVSFDALLFQSSASNPAVLTCGALVVQETAAQLPPGVARMGPVGNSCLDCGKKNPKFCLPNENKKRCTLHILLQTLLHFEAVLISVVGVAARVRGLREQEPPGGSQAAHQEGAAPARGPVRGLPVGAARGRRAAALRLLDRAGLPEPQGRQDMRPRA